MEAKLRKAPVRLSFMRRRSRRRILTAQICNWRPKITHASSETDSRGYLKWIHQRPSLEVQVLSQSRGIQTSCLVPATEPSLELNLIPTPLWTLTSFQGRKIYLFSK